ncbi:MAG: hypothetical protein JSS70_19795 [Bacteroidetes bacterium]|nr:hypothetical protein [Bacteroidota bacterium]
MKANLIYYAFTIILFTSCNTPRYVYAPSPPNTPFFREKGDSKISGAYSIGNDEGNGERNRGYDIQAAYAVTDHWAVTFDHSYRQEKDIYNFYEYSGFDSSIVRYRRQITSVGAGFFHEMNRRGTVMFNFYGGVGFGKFNINDQGIDDSLTAYTRFHNSHVTKWYLQPAINFMPGTAFWCSISTRFVFIKYSNIATSYNPEEQERFDLKNLNNRVLSFFEPSYNMLIGLPRCPWLKINGVVAFAANISSDNNDGYGIRYHSRGITGSLGLTFVPSKLREKK